MEFSHYTVMLAETVAGLNVRKNGIYVDCTLGGGGHSEEILKRLDGSGKLIGIDQDTMALEASKKRLSKFNNVEYVHNNFYNISEICNVIKIGSFASIIA